MKFVFETFKKLRPGIPLKCLHGKMNQEKRLGTYSQFCGKRAVLFSTDVSSRGLDFDKAVDWVVQVSTDSVLGLVVFWDSVCTDQIYSLGGLSPRCCNLHT